MSDPDRDAVMADPEPVASESSIASSQSISSHLLSLAAAGNLSSLPNDVATTESFEALDDLVTPFLPLLTRLQSSRRAFSTPQTRIQSTVLDTTLLRIEKTITWRHYGQVIADLSLSQLQAAVVHDSTAPSRRFERGSVADQVKMILCEWLLAPPGILDASELFMNELYQDHIAAILVHTLANSKLQPRKGSFNPFSIEAVTRRSLAVSVGPFLLSRLAVNDPSQIDQLLDAIVAVIIDTTAVDKTLAQQEQDAQTYSPFVLENAVSACMKVAKLSPFYAARLRAKLQSQTTSLQCTAVNFELLTMCVNAKEKMVGLYTWLKQDQSKSSALRTYIQLSGHDVTLITSKFQLEAVRYSKHIQELAFETLDRTDVSSYELTIALSVCVAYQVRGSFRLTEEERIRFLQCLEKIASQSVSTRAIRLAFLVIVFLWYPLASTLNKQLSQRDDHLKTAITLSQQVILSLFQARTTGAGPLFVVSAVLFYTKAPTLVPFLASVIGLEGSRGEFQAQEAVRAEYLHIVGEVVLKPILTESLLARQVLTFPPVPRISTSDAVAVGYGQEELTLRGLHGLLCERSFLRHYYGLQLENWIATQIGEHCALPIHPLLMSVLLEWIENYVLSFEYPITQAPRRLQLAIVPLRSTTLANWLTAPCLNHAYDVKQGVQEDLAWARGVLGLTYALQFNQRLRHATMVAGSKLGSLVSTPSVATSASVAAVGTGVDICLHYDLHSYPLGNIVSEVMAHGDQGGAFEFVAPTLIKLIFEEFPHLFDAATPSMSSGSTLQVIPLACGPQDLRERDLAVSWFRCRRRQGRNLPIVSVVSSPVSWTAVQILLASLQQAPIQVVLRELVVLINGFLPYAMLSSLQVSTFSRQVSAFCAQLVSLYETRARRERGPSRTLLMRFVHALCFPEIIWRHQQLQTPPWKALQLLTYMQILEEPFRLIQDAHEGVIREPAVLRLLLGLVRDVRVAANVYITKCDPAVLGPVGDLSTMTASVQQHLLVQDCLLVHELLKRLVSLRLSSCSHEVVEENRIFLCQFVNELVVADTERSASSLPRLLLAIHAQGYDVSLVTTLVEYVPSMRLLWDYWMATTSSTASSCSSASRLSTFQAKPLMEYIVEGAEKSFVEWRFRLRVVLSLCGAYLSGTRQSAAMQQALRVVWNKLRNGIGNMGETSAGSLSFLREVLPWIVDACSCHADLSAELVHFLLKLQRQSGASNDYSTAGKIAGQTQGQLLKQVLHDTYASLLEQM